MAITIGNVGHFSADDLTGGITLSTLDSSGVLVLFVEANFPTAPTVSSTTLGSWGSPRVQRNVAEGIFEWTKPFTSQLTNEVITYVDSTGSFISMDAVEVRGVPTSSYFDTHASIPANAASLPLTVSTNATDTIIFSSLRLVATPGTAGSGWTPISVIDWLITQYKIVSSAQSNMDILSGTGSNGVLADALISATPAVPSDRTLRIVQSGMRW